VNALKDFYKRQQSSFLAYLIRRTGDYDLSSDILQESFLRLFERYEAERLTPQLLYTIGRNMVIDRLRQRKTQPVTIEDHDCANTQEEHQHLVREEYRAVLTAMKQLEEDERDLLSLLISSGMGYREISAVTGLTEANVKVKVHRARKKLRNFMEMRSNAGPVDKPVHRR
jgi:RNA polymerase sigma-70 factor (ECF subfamily)